MICARFMRQDFFDFVPQFKIMIMGNHKPSVRSVDEAIKRRLNLLPFTVTIPKHERDPDLVEKLKPEWPGILYWMSPASSNGESSAASWRRPPSSMRLIPTSKPKTRSWRGCQIGVSEITTLGNPRPPCSPHGKGVGRAQWRIRRNHPPIAQALERHGIVFLRKNKARGYSGLRVIGDARAA